MDFGKKYLSHNNKPDFFLFVDTLHKSCRSFLYHHTKSYLSRGKHVTYISFDLPEDRLINALGQTNNLTIVNVFSDPLGWKSLSAEASFMSLDILKTIAEAGTDVIVLDSLSTLLFHHTPESVYRAIHNVVNDRKIPVVALLHDNAHLPEVSKLMKSLAASVIEVLPTDTQNKHVVMCILKAFGKKTYQQLLECSFGADLEEVIAKDIVVKQAAKPQVKRPDPAANLTFNLRLNEDEKASREKLELPYSKIQLSNFKVEDATIVEYDFYDEDDPDDDLDI